MIKYSRIPFVLLAIISLLIGLATGLNRMGWDLNMLHTSLHHGAIMVGGFLGTLVSLEKVIPLKKKMLFIIPASSGASVLLFFSHYPEPSFVLLVLASLSLSGVFLLYLLRTKDLIYFMMLCGSLCWLMGNMVLITKKLYPAAFPWWIGFILFIISAERLELTKFLPVADKMKKLLVALLFLYAGGVAWSFHSGGQWLSSAALIAVAVWMLRYDIVGISIRKAGLQRFIATALLCGYVAMLLTGIFLMVLMEHAFGYDVIIHTFFLGFAFSMIFAHGPVILPGVLGLSVKPWNRIMYLWLAILHTSLATRIGADLLLDMNLRKATGIASGIAIVGYFATVVLLIMQSRRPHAKVL